MTQMDQEVIAVKENLTILTDDERLHIEQVVHRDAELKDQHDQNFRNIKNEIQDLQRARDAEVDFGLNQGACALCMEKFGRFFNRGASCPWCNREVCSSCRLCTYSTKKAWMCSLCAREWQLRRMTGDWMPHPSERRRQSISLLILDALLAMKHATHQLLELPGKSGRSSSTTSQPSGNSISGKLGPATIAHRYEVLTTAGRYGTVASVKGSLGKGSSNLSLSSRITETFHQAQTGILHVQSDAMLYLQSTLKMAPFKPRRMSEDTQVKRQLDFDCALAPVPASSFDIFEDRFSHGSPSHVFLDNVDHNPGVTASTPVTDTLHDGPTLLPPNGNLNLSISSIATVLEDHVVTNLTSESCGDIQLKVTLKCESGAIEVSVIRCRGLPHLLSHKKKSGVPSPYVKIYLEGIRGGTCKRKTTVIADTSNPVFDQVLRFGAIKEKVAGWSLRVAVCHKERIFPTLFKHGPKRTVILGHTTMLMTENLLFMEHPLWIRLHKASEPSLLRSCTLTHT